LNEEKKVSVAEPIAQLQRQLEEFRSTHAPRSTIPEALWRKAAELASEHGLYVVAHSLHLDYSGLKRRLAEFSGSEDKKPAGSPGFVELIATPAGTTECVIELESRRGVQLRIQWKGSGAPDWVSLFRGAMIHLTAQMRVLVAIEAVDGKKYA
jgi:hypothetical protein